MEILFLVEQCEEGGFTAKAVGESIFTEADSMDDLKVNIREAVECHFENFNMPKFIRLHIVRDELITL